jgi:acetylornithine deacetylase/succinyl-diaminopimelate desuccinylase-like protein
MTIDLEAEVARRGDAFLDELIAFCRIPSVTGEAAAVRRAADFLHAAMRRRGLECRDLEVPGSPMVYMERRSAAPDAKTLLYYNHYDVRSDEPREAWHFDPFGGTLHEGKLYCRGASDHKGSLIARVQAVGLVAELRGDVPVTVKMIAEAEEEIGSPHLDTVVEKHLALLRADGCLYSGGTFNEFDQPQLDAGSRGGLTVELRCEMGEANIHGQFAPLVPDPAVRLTAAIHSLVGGDMTCHLPGFYDGLTRITEADRRELARIPFDWSVFREQFKVRRGVAGTDPLALVTRFAFWPPVTIATFEKSGQRGVVPAWAAATLSFRLIPGQEAERVVAQVSAHLAEHGFDDVVVRSVGKMGRPAKVPVDHWLVIAARRSAERVYGQDPVVWPLQGGSGPRYVFVERGIPVVANMGSGYAGSNDHAPDENIRVADYLKCVEHEADLLLAGLE